MLRADFVPDGGQPPDPTQSNNYFASGQPGEQGMHQPQFGMPLVNNTVGAPHPGANGQRYYTIQRVNGNGGNGKGDGVPGPHKHPLSESDRVKKNSVQRYVMKRDKEEKKTQVRPSKTFTVSANPFFPNAKSELSNVIGSLEQHSGLLASCKRSSPALDSRESSFMEIIRSRGPFHIFQTTTSWLSSAYAI
jgi:hypothetical protein